MNLTENFSGKSPDKKSGISVFRTQCMRTVIMETKSHCLQSMYELETEKRSPTMNLRLLALITLSVFIIAACSIETIYNQLDYIIPQYVESMVSLDDVIEEKLEQRVVVLINWHRNTQLKQYAEWLRMVQHDVVTKPDHSTVVKHISRLDSFWFSLSEKLNDEMAKLLPLLDSEQRNELFGRLAEKNEDFREEYVELSKEELLEIYQEELQDNFDNWLGSLSKEQRNIIAKSASQSMSTAELRLQRRIEWQTGIHRILVGKRDVKNISKELREFMRGFEELNSQVMKQSSDNNREVIAATIVAVAKTLSEKQKQYFITKTNHYIRMFIELSENR